MNTIGIDLGTTNTCLYDGHIYKLHKSQNNTNNIASSKIYMGKRWSSLTKDVKMQAKIIGHTLSEAPNDMIAINNKATSISCGTEIIQSLIHDNTLRYKAIITVPAYFNNIQRNDTKLAGLCVPAIEQVQLLNEPTAAALAFCEDVDYIENGDNILVMDIGGGTTDCSVVRLKDNTIKVLSTYGTLVGGNDITNYMTKEVLKNVIDTYKVKDVTKLLDNKAIKNDIWLSCEKCKKTDSVVRGKIHGYAYIVDPIVIYDAVQSIMAKCVVILTDAVFSAHLACEDINHIVLVGGSTKISAIKNICTQICKNAIIYDCDPFTIVSKGAYLSNLDKYDNVLVDVSSFAIGMKGCDGKTIIIAKKHIPLPFTCTKVFSPRNVNQRLLSIHFCEGESLLYKHNTHLSTVTVDDITCDSASTIKISIFVSVDISGLVTLKVTNVNTGSVKVIKKNMI